MFEVNFFLCFFFCFPFSFIWFIYLMVVGLPYVINFFVSITSINFSYIEIEHQTWIDPKHLPCFLVVLPQSFELCMWGGGRIHFYLFKYSWRTLSHLCFFFLLQITTWILLWCAIFSSYVYITNVSVVLSLESAICVHYNTDSVIHENITKFSIYLTTHRQTSLSKSFYIQKRYCVNLNV